MSYAFQGDEYRSHYFRDLEAAEIARAEEKKTWTPASDPVLGEVLSTAPLPKFRSSIDEFQVSHCCVLGLCLDCSCTGACA